MSEKLLHESPEIKIRSLQKELERIKRGRSLSSVAIKRHRRFLRFLPYPVLVRDPKGLITYLNPAFTKTFGWSLKELKGHLGDQHVPEDLKDELSQKARTLAPNKSTLQFNSRRLTKKKAVLDVKIRVGIDRDHNNNRGDMILVLKDVTMENRINRTQNTMNRISKSLPQYPELRRLLFFINNEIKDLLGTGNATTLLLTRDRKELFFLSAAHEDWDAREQIEKARFPVEDLLAGKVVKTGLPLMINDSSANEEKTGSYESKFGYPVKNILMVPLRIEDQIIGAMAADNKKTGNFDETDLETLNILATTVTLSIANARATRQLRAAYEDVKSLNRAKDKMINHLSHELRTPVAVLLTSIQTLGKRLEILPEKNWESILERIHRNLDRIIGIESEVSDIVGKKEFQHHQILGIILEQCQDAFESFVEAETGNTGIIEKIRQKIDSIFVPKDLEIKDIFLDRFVENRLAALKPQMAHRAVNIISDLHPCPLIKMPQEPLKKTVDGLIRNAVENTPDRRTIDIIVCPGDFGIEFIVKDQGIGLTSEAQKRIFEGFFATQDMLKYSSKRPFDFNAGGKGADLLRMKIFSERYHFKISMASNRCQRLPENGDVCPGTMEKCQKISGPSCNGMTTVTCFFPFPDTDM